MEISILTVTGLQMIVFWKNNIRKFFETSFSGGREARPINDVLQISNIVKVLCIREMN